MPAAIVEPLAKQTGTSVAEVERLWHKAKKIAAKKFPADSDALYQYTVGILKRMLSVSESETTESQARRVLRLIDALDKT